MAWRRGFFDDYSHLVDVLPPIQKIEYHLIVSLPPPIALPVRHWTFNDNGVLLGFMLLLKDWKLVHILYTPSEPAEGPKFRGTISKESFGSPEEVRERLRQFGSDFPPGYTRSHRNMQRDVDNGEISCWLTSSSGKYDPVYGYRNFVPIDEVGQRMSRTSRVRAWKNGRVYKVTY